MLCHVDVKSLSRKLALSKSWDRKFGGIDWSNSLNGSHVCDTTNPTDGKNRVGKSTGNNVNAETFIGIRDTATGTDSQIHVPLLCEKNGGRNC
jgi:hypothetical protein